MVKKFGNGTRFIAFAHAGTYVVNNYHVDLKPDNRAIIEPANSYQKVNNHWTPMHEDGFEFNANAMVEH